MNNGIHKLYVRMCDKSDLLYALLQIIPILWKALREFIDFHIVVRLKVKQIVTLHKTS